MYKPFCLYSSQLDTQMQVGGRKFQYFDDSRNDKQRQSTTLSYHLGGVEPATDALTPTILRIRINQDNNKYLIVFSQSVYMCDRVHMTPRRLTSLPMSK